MAILAASRRPAGDFRSTYAADSRIYATEASFWRVTGFVLLIAILPLVLPEIDFRRDRQGEMLALALAGGVLVAAVAALVTRILDLALLGAIWVVILLISRSLGSFYVLDQIIQIGIMGIAALGLNIVVGFTGQISLGHAAFFGFGAYTSAWLSTNPELHPLLAIPLAGVATAAVGALFGLPALRIKGLYLAIATLAAQYILQDFFSRAEGFTGGVNGAAAAPITLFGLNLQSDTRFLYIVLAFVILCFGAVTNLMRSRDGRAMIAVRDHYLSAEIMGIRLGKYRVLSFALGAFFAGIAGGLVAHDLGFVNAERFTVQLSIQFLAMIIIGGLGSVQGSLMGAAFILLLPSLMQALVPAVTQPVAGLFGAGNLDFTVAEAYLKEISIGAAIILFLIFEPDGLAHRWQLIKAWWKLYPFSY